MNKDLVEYIENEVFPLYSRNEEGHGINHIKQLIEEFENMETKESIFAKMCDKLEADIQCKLYCEENCIDINKKEN